MEIWHLHKSKIIGGFAAIGLVGYLIWMQFQPESTELHLSDVDFLMLEDTDEAKGEELLEEKQESLPIMVDVKGAVIHPGVYNMKEGDRVMDAIEKAGGFQANAETKMVNLAALLSDELVVFVPKEGEEFTFINFQEGTGEQLSSNGKININTASEEELTRLTGIGPAKAKAIIQYRTENGFFKKEEDLLQVSGIGQKSFDNIRNDITVSN
ncbi:helix-hairpin-helix domain-containing protein [Sutcliffiella rhizosphaerae]|uniref:Helix-hairpin-helix DNA-binding motif class 1 domain-containing protein n=1 Tax=Sutcliffiella rhizosphaerae TaxID=2880967 RepID=A0ABN8A6L8_9BACI|nr:helix-hairpin-helix domain-containing protein [Sutcliffiella rhizosphaerae]CAG9619386.1 hypothetical protein BACCIP111883_00153 [Sutcliffiella rhizosphaerae]